MLQRIQTVYLLLVTILMLSLLFLPLAVLQGGDNFYSFDVWGLSCKHILNCDEYRELCKEENWLTASGKYYKSSAETCYRFFKGNNEFIESHTAIDDTEIESELFAEILRRTKNKFEMGIIYFPFRIVGKIEFEE